MFSRHQTRIEEEADYPLEDDEDDAIGSRSQINWHHQSAQGHFQLGGGMVPQGHFLQGQGHHQDQHVHYGDVLEQAYVTSDRRTSYNGNGGFNSNTSFGMKSPSGVVNSAFQLEKDEKELIPDYDDDNVGHIQEPRDNVQRRTSAVTENENAPTGRQKGRHNQRHLRASKYTPDTNVRTDKTSAYDQQDKDSSKVSEFSETAAIQPHKSAIATATDVHGGMTSDDAYSSNEVIFQLDDDLANLEHLTNENLLEHIQSRFSQDQPYTYIGDSLVAVNPCRELNIYTDEYHENYRRTSVRCKQPPHIFWIAAQIYRNLVTTRANQCVVVGGDSGAGKTESTKFILSHLVKSGSAKDATGTVSGNTQRIEDTPDIVAKLEKVSPLLELFGNAATVLNENSSRFGKLVELEYDEKGTLTTARLECFILEKFRVTSRHPLERNFHVFYSLFAGLDRRHLQELRLDDPEMYRILRQDNPTEPVFQSTEELDKYRERFLTMDAILTDVGFGNDDDEEISPLYRCLAAILHIANIDFEADAEEKVIIPDGIPTMSLENACVVLGLEDSEDLENCLLTVNMEVKGERVVKSKSERHARDGRDALARELYSVLFYGVIDSINRSLQTGEKDSSSFRHACIRLLDISGFENVEGHNSFEQFVINSTNEKLHQYFLQHTFTAERREYEAEDMPVVDVEFRDNSHIVDLIFKKPEGLIPLLEDINAVNGTDKGWLEKCRSHGHDPQVFHTQPKSRSRVNMAFGITHYAGQVVYSAEGFVEKNSDTLPHNLREAVLRSNNSFIRDYFSMGSDAAASLHKSGRASLRKSHGVSRRGIPTPFTGGDGGSKKRTGKLSGRFTDQYQISLSRMLNKLQTATPVFVRCIKPNLQLKPGEFDRELVLSQLLSNGLLEVTRIRKEGYPIRIKFADFVKRYQEITDQQQTQQNGLHLQDVCQTILREAGVTGCKIGKSKVFLKTDHRDQLETAMEKKRHEREERERKERERPKTERPEKNRRRSQLSQATMDTEDTGSLSPDRLSASNFRTSSGSESGISTASGLSHSPRGHVDDVKAGEGTLADISEKEEAATEEEKKKKKKEKLRKEGVGNQPAYNIFRLTERDVDSGNELEMKARRCVRFLLYILFACLILAGGVVARVAIVWMGSAEINNLDTADFRRLLDGRPNGEEISKFKAGLGPARLLICQLIPLIMGWLTCLLKVMFGHKDWPTFKALVVVLAIDCAGAFGRSVFLFKVLPKTDALTALVIGTAVCQVPGVMKLVSSLLSRRSAAYLKMAPAQKRWAQFRHYIYVILLVISVLVQIGAVPLLTYCDVILGAITSSAEIIKLPDLWVLVVVTAGVSLGWWENYAYGGITINKRTRELATWRVGIGRIRQTSYVYSGPVQMVIIVVSFFYFNDSGIDMAHQISVIFSSFVRGFGDGEVFGTHFTVYGPMYLQIAGTIVCSYLSALACRLYMQRAGFALPVCLIAPAAMALVFFCTPSRLAHWFDFSNHCVTTDITHPQVLYILALGGAVCLSTVIINGHVWLPEVERTAKMERLFAFPHRDPVYPDVCLQCTRRQDREENAERMRRHKKSDGKVKEGRETSRPKVYICATMWHEERHEMLQLLKSLFRIDFDVYTRQKAQKNFHLLEEHSDLYDPEIHIIFDDAFFTHEKTKQRVVNKWVQQLIEVMPEALASVAKRTIELKPPQKTATPYGGRLTFEFPGGTRMEVHLKDKDRIRHRKRWSQILYLYYLLGFKLMRNYRTVNEVMDAAGSVRSRRRRRHRVRRNTSILNNMPPEKVREADNIFLMALDGDVDFRPDSVRLLLDRMKKNKKVAAVCGRIHPIGDGPMVWYQQFEYAVGHWLQKAAEHVFGCVLCCPGCFSLFRGSALMDDNVMRMYTTEPTEAIHFIQYEQGEDRWLCTLLLQQGWKIEYCAGADALTYAPEKFHDFYIQRRRWSPSTMANIVDLISSWRVTVKMNDNISVLFMLYQFVLLSSSVVAPGLVVFMIAGSYNTVLKIELWESYLLSVLPVFLYVLLCLKASTNTQINVAAILSAVYTIVMLLVTIGTIINLATTSFLNPDVLFLLSLSIIFVVAGLVHPNELFCLFHGILYYLTVPSTFVFLTVYFLCNLHVVTWGTREGPKKPEQAEEQKSQEVVVEKGKLYKFFEKLGLTAVVQDIKAFMQQMIGLRQEQQQPNNQQNNDNKEQQEQTQSSTQNQQRKNSQGQKQNGPASQAQTSVQKQTASSGLVNGPNTKPGSPFSSGLATGGDAKASPPVAKPEEKVEPDHTYWTSALDIPGSKVGNLEEDEEKFWLWLLEEYLHPLAANKEQQEKIKADLLSARNNVVFAFMLVNLMFTLVLLQLRLQRDVLIDTFYIAGKYEPASTLALGIFSILLLTQFAGMIGHRWSTFMHLIASTKLRFFNAKDEEERALEAIHEAQKLLSASAEGDLELGPEVTDEDDVADDVTTLASTPHPSNGNLKALEEGHGLGGGAGEETEPDYSDDNDKPDYSDNEGETEFGGHGHHVQYDQVFNPRYRTVRRQMEPGNRQNHHHQRTPLYIQHQSSALARTRYQRDLHRRQSLYKSIRLHQPTHRPHHPFSA